MMNTRIQNKTSFAVAAILCVAFANSRAVAEVLVYEGFQYDDPATPDGLEGQPNDPGGSDTDATGLSGTWQDQTSISTGNLFLKSGSLTFGDLTTSGNHVGSNTNLNNDTFLRSVTADLDSGSELWFSVLAEKLQNNNSAAEGGLVIGNQAVGNSRILENDGTDGLQGFGVAPTTSGNDWRAYAWDGSSQSFSGDLNVGVGSGDIRLLVGQISFNTGTAGADEYNLYEYILNAGSITGGSLRGSRKIVSVFAENGYADRELDSDPRTGGGCHGTLYSGNLRTHEGLL